MGLSCDCGDGYEWWYRPANDVSSLETKTRRRCASCAELINIGSPVLKLFRYRSPNDDIEERIYGDEVPLADKYFCETCSDLYYSLDELGLCVSLDGRSLKQMITEDLS